MSIEFLTVLIFGLMLVSLATGVPISFALGGLAMIFTYFLWGDNALGMIANRMYGIMSDYVVLAVPLFIFMGMLLEKSGIADELYTMMHKWIGHIRGGLAVGTVLICTIFAAMSGLSATATVTMGIVALPAMFKRNYDKDIALGCISAGGALGILIPPSATMVVYALVARQSVGQLFMGGVFPGLLMSVIFIIYILVRCQIQPHLGPAVPKEERATWGERLVSLRAVILPIFIVVMVLGTIFAGITTPTESAAMGALGTVIATGVRRKLNWRTVKEACYETLKISSMGMWIYLGSLAFSTIYTAVGATDLIEKLFRSMPGGRWGAMLAIQLVWLVLGCFLDPWGTIMITGPIFISIMAHFGFNLVWFGVLWVINTEMAYLTPPFGFNLFYLKAVAPRDVTMSDIWRSIWPFVGCQALALALVMIFPQLVLWLPSQMIKTAGG